MPKKRGVECRQSADLSAGVARYNYMTLFWCLDESRHLTRFSSILRHVLYAYINLAMNTSSFKACKILLKLNYEKDYLKLLYFPASTHLECMSTS